MLNTKARAVIVMGVASSGKSTVGAELAKRLNWTFLDAATFHPEATSKE
jgi:gluconate kinase